MTNIVTLVPTIRAIKRRAKELGRAQNIPHHQALDDSARAFGFQNLRHAQSVLGSDDSPAAAPRTHALYLTAYWRTESGAEGGRETLLIRTNLVWPDLLKPQDLRSCRGLRHFRRDAVDHFESKRDLINQAAARSAVCEAARTIQFMEATGLRPNRSSRMSALERAVHDLPGRDHNTTWIDPESETLVVADEPYHYGERELGERKGWAKEHALAISAPAWAGLYVPGSSTLYLLTHQAASSLLERVTERLTGLPPPITEEQWSGTSAPFSPVFVSPGRDAAGVAKRARPRPPYAGELRKGATPYGRFLSGVEWRPYGRMPLAAHQEVAATLKLLLANTLLYDRTRSQLTLVRFELDEWITQEYSSKELSQEIYRDLYYGRAASQNEQDPFELIERVRARLLEHYRDCGPRKRLLRRLDSACRSARQRDASRRAS